MISRRFIKFLITGGTAALTEYITFLILQSVLDINVVVANSLSFLCGLMVSFLLNKHWVFTSKNSMSKEFVKYGILALVNLVLSNLLLLALTKIIHPVVAKLFVMGMIAIWNYVIFSRIVFKKTDII